MAKRFLIWFWSGGGGGSTFTVNLARRLRLQFGDDAVALSLRADDPVVARARAEGLLVRAADIVSDRRRPLATMGALARSRDVLHAHAADADVVIVPMNFATAAPLSATLRKPLIYCAHDPAPHPGDYARFWQRTTQTVLLARAARVVALSEYAAAQLRRRVSGKLVVAPLASVFEPRPSPRPAGGPTRLLFAGRMIAYKGVDLLAQALPLLATRTDWTLRVAGFGPALDAAAAARFALPQVSRVETGWLSDAELETLIAETDIVLAPYLSATQSGVVAEAMAFGKPCVVTPVGALAEQIDGGAAGWVAEATSSDAIAATIAHALDRPDERAQRAAAAGEAATAAWRADHWSWLSGV